jgi:hypothetical protein
MEQAGVDRDLVRKSVMEMPTGRILPFRFIAAASHAPHLEPELESAMFRNAADLEKLEGRTHLLVDVSGSMGDKLSSKSDLTRQDAACGLAMLLREVCPSLSVYTFSNSVVEVPGRRGFALRDAIDRSQPNGGTYLGAALNTVAKERIKTGDRVIVITDEQSHDRVPDLIGVGKAYMINVASNKNGVGYGSWTHVDGFSEAIVNYITQSEK